MFKNNVVIITGASTGIGEELAYQLAAQGAHLMLSARRVDELERVARAVLEIYATHGHAVADVACFTTDVAIASQCKALIDETLKHFGRIDTLVNNAGMSMWARFADIADITILERIMQVNYMGAVYCTHYALPHLTAVEGRIVGINTFILSETQGQMEGLNTIVGHFVAQMNGALNGQFIQLAMFKAAEKVHSRVQGLAGAVPLGHWQLLASIPVASGVSLSRRGSQSLGRVSLARPVLISATSNVMA